MRRTTILLIILMIFTVIGCSKKTPTFRDAEGKIHYGRNCANGNSNGINEEFYKSGTLLRKWRCFAGKKDGITQQYDKTGRLEAEWNYEDGMLQGISKEYFPS